MNAEQGAGAAEKAQPCADCDNVPGDTEHIGRALALACSPHEDISRRLAEEAFRHSWDTSDERRIDGQWTVGLCCECGAFVPIGSEVEHLSAAFAGLLNPPAPPTSGCDR